MTERHPANKRYLKLVEWSDEDDCFVGLCPGLFYGGCHGDDESAVYQELCDLVDEMLEDFEATGDPLPPATAGKHYSGRFNLRVGEDLHKLLAIRSLKDGDSLNTYCVKALQRAVGSRRD
jgi:predicted HicB family RNase H-like nuclease